jgi:hypothetical protein
MEDSFDKEPQIKGDRESKLIRFEHLSRIIP